LPLSVALNNPDETIELHTSGAPGKVHIESIALRGVFYTFPAREGEPGFALGPVNLHINQGDILFIAGENGCG